MFGKVDLVEGAAARAEHHRQYTRQPRLRADGCNILSGSGGWPAAERGPEHLHVV